jgi:hypothetical protein
MPSEARDSIDDRASVKILIDQCCVLISSRQPFCPGKIVWLKHCILVCAAHLDLALPHYHQAIILLILGKFILMPDSLVRLQRLRNGWKLKIDHRKGCDESLPFMNYDSTRYHISRGTGKEETRRFEFLREEYWLHRPRECLTSFTFDAKQAGSIKMSAVFLVRADRGSEKGQFEWGGLDPGTAPVSSFDEGYEMYYG